ncbi:MAG: phage tail protein [Campylobacterales bacterium]|nr:phage tail protein [Campylobacterales bacterium]
MADLIRINNPFDDADRETLSIKSGTNIYSVLADMDYDLDIYEIQIWRNQTLVERDFRISDDDVILIVLVPRGGGGDSGGGKSIGRAVAFVAVAIIAAYTGGAAAGYLGYAEGSFGYAAVSVGVAAAVTMAGAALINHFMPLPTFDPAINSMGYDSIASSPTYSWGQAVNATAQGTAVPILYGKMRVTPPRVATHVESLASEQYLNMLFTVAEGQINNIADIEINSLPISSFSGVSYEIRDGAATQNPIPWFDTIYADIAYGRGSNNAQYVIETDGNVVDTLSLVFYMPYGIYYANDTGGMDYHIVRIGVQYRRKGTATWLDFEAEGYSKQDKVNGVTCAYRYLTQAPSRQNIAIWTPSGDIADLENCYEFIDNSNTATRRTLVMRNLDPDQYEIRITPYTMIGHPRYGEVCVLEYISEGVTKNFSYPATALLALRIKATEQLNNSVPAVTAIATGRISSPADACIDLFTHPRYGGGVDISRLPTDNWGAFRTFCSKNNFVLNLYIDQIMTLRKTLDIITQMSRAVVVQRNSKFVVIFDDEDLPARQGFLFTSGNIIKDSFQIDYIPLTERANVIEVTFANEANNYKQETITVSSDDSIVDANKTAITLYGVTNYTQAHLFAQYLLKKNRLVTQTYSFEASIDSIHCQPGDPIKISIQTLTRCANGRIEPNSTFGNIILDSFANFEDGKTYFIELRNIHNDKIYELELEPVSGETNIVSVVASELDKLTDYSYYDSEAEEWITPSISIGTLIPEYSIYTIGEPQKTSKKARMLDIDIDSDLKATIRAVEYVPEVYTGYVMPTPTQPDTAYVIPYNIRANSYFYKSMDGAAEKGVELVWIGKTLSYNVWYKKSNDLTWILASTIAAPTIKIQNLIEGVEYDFAIGRTIQESGTIKYTPSYTEIEVSPLAPSSFSASFSYPSVILSWNSAPSTESLTYEIRDGSVPWDNASLIGRTLQNNLQIPATELGTFFYRIKTLTPNGKYSNDSLITSVTIPQIPELSNIVLNPSIIGISFKCDTPNRGDFAGVKIWCSKINPPDTDKTPTYNGISTIATIDKDDDGNSIEVGTTYYIICAGYSKFGQQNLNYSAILSSAGTNPVDNVSDGSITEDKLGDVGVIKILNSLPSLPNTTYKQGRVIYLTSDNKLYRSTGSNWTPDVTEADINAAINSLIDGAPAALNTLKELADKLTEEDSAVSSIISSLSNKADKATTLAGYGITDAAPKDSPNFTGSPTAPTKPYTDNSAAIATTAYVKALLASGAGSAPYYYVDGTRDDGHVAIGASISSIGIRSVILGYGAKAGSYGVAIGEYAMSHGGTGIAIGSSALKNQSNSVANTVIGYNAAAVLSAGNANVALGTNALNYVASGNYNVAIGDSTLTYMQTFGSAETNQAVAIGYQANYTGDASDGTVAIGYKAGYYGKKTYCTFIGNNACSNNLTGITNATSIGYNSTVTASNQVQLGNSSTTTYVYGTVQNRSDLRDKADIRDTVLGLDFIKAIRAVDYKWDMRDDYKNGIRNGKKKRSRYHHGVIAQEVKRACEKLDIDFGGYQDHTLSGGSDVLSIGYDEFIAPLIKAVQELSLEVEKLKTKR